MSYQLDNQTIPNGKLPKAVRSAGVFGFRFYRVGVAKNEEGGTLSRSEQNDCSIVIGSGSALFAENAFLIQPLDKGRVD
jgi:hypothetical protein